MKQSEPIVIQEETELRHEMRIEQAIPEHDDVIDIVAEDSIMATVRIGITKQAAIRLRDALNTILND